MLKLGNNNRGFSLVELSTAMVASAILMVGFSSVIVFSRNQLTDTNVRVALSYDQVLLDRYIRTKLTSTIGDSMQIFSSAQNELNGITDSVGPILRAVDADSTVYHLDITGGTLLWMVDSTLHNPVDADVSDLMFYATTGSNKKRLRIAMNLSKSGDTLAPEWSLTLRN